MSPRLRWCWIEKASRSSDGDNIFYTLLYAPRYLHTYLTYLPRCGHEPLYTTYLLPTYYIHSTLLSPSLFGLSPRLSCYIPSIGCGLQPRPRKGTRDFWLATRLVHTYLFTRARVGQLHIICTYVVRESLYTLFIIINTICIMYVLVSSRPAVREAWKSWMGKRSRQGWLQQRGGYVDIALCT